MCRLDGVQEELHSKIHDLYTVMSPGSRSERRILMHAAFPSRTRLRQWE